MSPTSVIATMMQRIDSSIQLLERHTGFYRPSFPRFYNFFYWQSPDPQEEILLTMKAIAMQYLVTLSPVERVLLNKLGKIMEWNEDPLNYWLKQSFHPLIQVQSTEILVKASESGTVLSSSIIQFLFLDEIYPSLQIRGSSLQISSPLSSSPSSSPSTVNISGKVESIRGSPKLMKIQLILDLLPKNLPPLGQFQSRQSFNADFQFDIIDMSIQNPLTTPIRIRATNSVIQCSPSASIGSFDRIGISMQQGGMTLLLAYLQYGKIQYSNSCLSVAPSLYVKISLSPSIYSYLNPLPYYPSVSFCFNYVFNFAVLDVTLLTNPLTIQLIATEGTFDSDTIYTLKKLQLNVAYPNNKPRSLAKINHIYGMSSIFEIDKIQAGISASIVHSLVALKSDLQPWITRFFTEPRINRILNHSEQKTLPIDSFLIHVKSLELMYVSLHPDPNLVHQVGLIGQISHFSLSSTTLSWQTCEMSVKSSELPFSMEAFSNLNSAACILSIPSLTIEYSNRILSFQLPAIQSAISLSEMSMILGLLNEVNTANHGHIVAIPRKVDREQLFEKRNQWLQRKWSHQFEDTNDLLEVLNAMCRSMEVQEMKLPEKVELVIDSIDVQLNIEQDMISKVNFTQLECELLVENNSLIHSTFIIDFMNLFFNHPTLDRPLKVKRFILPVDEANSRNTEADSTTMVMPSKESEPLSPILQVTLNIELSQLPRVSSVVVSISPLQLHFSIPALKSIASFFEEASISKQPKPSPLSQAINLRYLRVNAIHVYCELFSSVAEVNYALIPFRLHPITLHDRICSIKQIFSSLRMHLIADLLSQATQHVSQASAVMANAMGFSGIVSLLRRPIPVPLLVSKKRKKKQRSKKIRLLLGKHVHDSPIPSQSESTPICMETQQETFVNSRFEELQNMIFLVFLLKQ